MPTKPIKKCAVVGVGLMGSGIARLLSLHNLPVLLKDKDAGLIEKGLLATTSPGSSAYEPNNTKDFSVKKINPLITGTLDYSDFKDVDLVIEAVTENPQIKKAVLKEISKAVRGDTIIASNTSTIPISKLATSVSRPERFLGMHFFYPADSREFIEIIRGKETSEKVTRVAERLSKKLGKIPVVLNDGPGFLVNRTLSLYLTEASHCLLDGLNIEETDALMLNFGMAVGPLFLLDLVGIDLAYEINNAMIEELNSPRLQLSPAINKINAAHRSGKNAHFYSHENGIKTPNLAIYKIIGAAASSPLPKKHYLDRMLYTIINEAARCLEEKIAEDAKTIDLGLLLGMGFALSTAGPLKYADSIGLPKIVENLDKFKNMYGPRFDCAPLLRKMAAENKTFYERTKL